MNKSKFSKFSISSILSFFRDVYKGKSDITAENNDEETIDTKSIKPISNKMILRKQIMTFGFVVILTASLMLLIYYIVKLKTNKHESVSDNPTLKIDLADKNLNPEEHWRNYFEELRVKDKEEFEQKLQSLEELHQDTIAKTQRLIEEEITLAKTKLDMAQRELASASLDLKRAKEDEENKEPQDTVSETSMGILNYGDATENIEYDYLRSAKHYVPEGTYFTGNLLGGIVVSTAITTQDSNATPVAIRLTSRGNLAKENDLDISRCRIMGSCYGDLSSERVIIRLEKLICEREGVYITSKIAGQVFGHDGYNGIKGTVVSTSNKHIQNAMIGGLISGFSQSSKTSESAIISSSGLVNTAKQGVKDNLKTGLLQGTSNAGDKLADYYLRQAESMSPVLTVPSGAKVNTQIIEGFYVGEIGTHKRIKQTRIAQEKELRRNNIENNDND